MLRQLCLWECNEDDTVHLVPMFLELRARPATCLLVYLGETQCIQSVLKPLFCGGCTGGQEFVACSSQVSSFYLHIRTYQPHDSTLLYLINVIVYHINLEKLEGKKYGKELEGRLFSKLHPSLNHRENE